MSENAPQPSESDTGALAGRVAIVTGAGRGIGRATAVSLARCGARVVVNDIGTSLSGDSHSAAPASAVAAEITETGGEACASTDSVADWSSAQRIIETALTRFGRIDILVNNAGLSTDAPIWELEPEIFDRVVRSHLHGGFHCLRAAAPHMRAQGFGRVVNLVSRAGLVGVPGTVAYGAAKGGLFGLTNVAARDLASFGITVNAVNPAATETRMVTTAIDNLERGGTDEAKRARALREVLQPAADVASLITALCFDTAGRINGQVVYLERGRVGLFHPLSVERDSQIDGAVTVRGVADALAGLEPFDLGAVYRA